MRHDRARQGMDAQAAVTMGMTTAQARVSQGSDSGLGRARAGQVREAVLPAH